MGKDFKRSRQFEWHTKVEKLFNLNGLPFFYCSCTYFFLSFLIIDPLCACLCMCCPLNALMLATFWFLKAPKHNRNEWPLTNYSKCHESQIKYLQTSRHRAKGKKTNKMKVNPFRSGHYYMKRQNEHNVVNEMKLHLWINKYELNDNKMKSAKTTMSNNNRMKFVVEPKLRERS